MNTDANTASHKLSSAKFVATSILLTSILGMPQPGLTETTTESELRDRRVIEEIIVSAQRRDQALQDVPISMSVLDDDFLVGQGITDLETALLFVPNVQVQSAGFFSAPSARGFTFNNNNKAFEPPLGLAIDGIPYTRIPYFMAATFDLKRIEVLRGPQGTTFGKNTTAGLIHMLTKDPTEEFSGSISAQSGELNRQRLELALSGPLVPNFLNFRVAGFDDRREGFVTNTTAAISPRAQERFRGHDRDGFRVKLDFVNLLGSTLKLSYEQVSLKDFGTGFEIIRATPQAQAFLQQYDPNTSFERGNFTASLNDPDNSHAHINTFNAQWSYSQGEWDLVLLGGHSVLKHDLELDTDFTPAPAIFGLGTDRSPTTTAEFRVISPTLHGLFGLQELFGVDLGSSEFVAGVFHQRRSINDSEFRFIFDIPAFLGLTAATNVDGGDPLTTILELLPPGLLPGLTDELFIEDASQTFEQEARELAFFGEFQWHFLPKWTLQAGIRQSRETKTGEWHQFFNQPQPALILPLSGLDEFEAARRRNESEFQHKIAINWQPTDNISLFLHRAKAVKGGGFNAFSFRGVADELEYEPEFTTEWALHAKTQWLDNTLAANMSIYRMDVDDFQVLVRDPERALIGVGVPLVENAAKARAQGVELDLQWRPLQWLTLIATSAYNDTEYLDFTNNECPADQLQDGGCDATGKSFPFAPEWNNTLTALVQQPLFNTGFALTASATVEYFSKQIPDLDLDPRKVEPSFTRYKASVGISHLRQGWSLRFVGENLSNEVTTIRTGDLFPGLFVAIPEQPRLFYGQFTLTF